MVDMAHKKQGIWHSKKNTLNIHILIKFQWSSFYLELVDYCHHLRLGGPSAVAWIVALSCLGGNMGVLVASMKARQVWRIGWGAAASVCCGTSAGEHDNNNRKNVHGQCATSCKCVGTRALTQGAWARKCWAQQHASVAQWRTVMGRSNARGMRAGRVWTACKVAWN